MSGKQLSDYNRMISENLALLDNELTSVEERRCAHLFDRASLLARDENLLLSEERCEIFRRIFDRGSQPDGASQQAVGYIDGCLTAQLLADKLAVCKYLAGHLRARGDIERLILSGSPENGSQPEVIEQTAAKKVAYLKNAYADTAFRRFSEVLGELSVVYCTDFDAVCEEVYYGRADMCILPLDSSRDAKLIGFMRLVDKYELRIKLSCDITSSDQSVTTRYALLTKSAEYPAPSMLELKVPLFFEFSFVPDETNTLASVLFLSECCQLKLYKVDAIPLTYSDSEFSYDVVLDCTTGSIDTFALYMLLSVPQYELLGIYPHLGGD